MCLPLVTDRKPVGIYFRPVDASLSSQTELLSLNTGFKPPSQVHSDSLPTLPYTIRKLSAHDRKILLTPAHRFIDLLCYSIWDRIWNVNIIFQKNVKKIFARVSSTFTESVWPIEKNKTEHFVRSNTNKQTTKREKNKKITEIMKNNIDKCDEVV